MTKESSLLDRYQQLVTSHREQFEPSLIRLRQFVEAELGQLRQQEADLVQSQVDVLQALQVAIATDVRFLLQASEFQEFINELPQLSMDNPTTSNSLSLDRQVANWSIAQSEWPVQIVDYEFEIDPDDYDDERTYTSYGYRFSMIWGDSSIAVERIRTERIYGVSLPGRVADLSEQIEEIQYWVGELLENRQPTTSELTMLAEISYLVVYACQLLNETPRTVQFAYDSNSGEGAE
jgi:hypothetical protein